MSWLFFFLVVALFAPFEHPPEARPWWHRRLWGRRGAERWSWPLPPVWFVRPRRTAADVARELADGLEDGTVTLR